MAENEFAIFLQNDGLYDKAEITKDNISGFDGFNCRKSTNQFILSRMWRVKSFFNGTDNYSSDGYITNEECR